MTGNHWSNPDLLAGLQRGQELKHGVGRADGVTRIRVNDVDDRPAYKFPGPVRHGSLELEGGENRIEWLGRQRESPWALRGHEG